MIVKKIIFLKIGIKRFGLDQSQDIQMWTPIFQKGYDDGQIEIIVGSYGWGHVPHKIDHPLISLINLKQKNKIE